LDPSPASSVSKCPLVIDPYYRPYVSLAE
jgi:hypothetical protein